MTEPRQLEATATRDGRWWLVRIPELDAVGQARTVRDILPSPGRWQRCT